MASTWIHKAIDESCASKTDSEKWYLLAFLIVLSSLQFDQLCSTNPSFQDLRTFQAFLNKKQWDSLELSRQFFEEDLRCNMLKLVHPAVLCISRTLYTWVLCLLRYQAIFLVDHLSGLRCSEYRIKSKVSLSCLLELTEFLPIAIELMFVH